MMDAKVEKLPVDVFEAGPGSVRGAVIELLLKHVAETGREAWCESNGVMIRAMVGDTAAQVEERWQQDGLAYL
jgi:hypothetical protein